MHTVSVQKLTVDGGFLLLMNGAFRFQAVMVGYRGNGKDVVNANGSAPEVVRQTVTPA